MYKVQHTIGSCPSRRPNLMPRTAWGDRLMFSAPPVRTISLSPRLISFNKHLQRRIKRLADNKYNYDEGNEENM